MFATKTLSLAIVLAFSVTACAEEDDGSLDSTLTIDNDSSYTFVEINLSPENTIAWGPDLLGAEVLNPGEVFEVSGIACDTYDIRVIDEDGDMCIVQSVDLCLENAVWQIDNLELAACTF
ncbi:MAG: hypothetical protein H0T42_21650 [Deltaproteobacteria bacterium]|nr:hypothetical protein [Deltaproteobacteria bacterium]